MNKVRKKSLKHWSHYC